MYVLYGLTEAQVRRNRPRQALGFAEQRSLQKELKYRQFSFEFKCGFDITHRIHGAAIYGNIGGILMVNVTIYTIHGSYGLMMYCIQRIM